MAAMEGARPTLLIRHLPEGMPADTLKRLFSHYGASDFRLCTSAKLKNCAFVDYESEAAAAAAQSQMHRLKFLGKVLSVERARPASTKDGLSEETSAAEGTEAAPPPPPPPPAPESVQASGREPIASSLGLDYPFPPHLERKAAKIYGTTRPLFLPSQRRLRILVEGPPSSSKSNGYEEYAYPPPDGNILTNIVNTLIAVPRFYTQVLHLMNKMNLPAPFRPALPTPPLPPPVPAPVTEKRQAGELSSDESELESSDEEGNNAPAGEAETDAPEEELDAHKARRKRAKLEAVVGPAVDKSASHEAAGLKSINIIPKTAPIKKNKPVMQIKISTKASVSEGASRDVGNREEMDATTREEVDDPARTATLAELQAGQLSEAEFLSLSVLKNYAAGTPSQVLYIKNLAKEVVPEDLFYVFGAFFADLEEAKNALNVNLMQEGRMRGQAFVTFPSPESAQNALVMTHGFVLKGKPMIVQFGRNRSAAKT